MGYTGRLTVAKANSLTAPGMYRADPTLYLRIAPSGAKSWIQRLTIDGRRHDLGLGGFPLVSLVEAREQAFDNRRKVRMGGNPLAEKRRATVPTFAEAAEKRIVAERPNWRGPKSERDWRACFNNYVFPEFGAMPVDQVEREDVLRALTPIWTTMPETARRIRGRIRKVFEWAQAHRYIRDNPAGEAISGALPTIRAGQQHFRALPVAELPKALKTVRESPASLSARLCLELVVLTATRSGEARNATWTEVDTEAREWRIPGSRMKGGRGHRVPLSDAALSVLAYAQALDDGSGLVFPSPLRAGRPLSDMTLTKILRDHGLAERATVHGFRSAFRDWCAETGKPREIAEAALAHTVGGVEGAYFRSDLFARRRALMDQWAAFLTEAEARVVRLYG